MARATPDLVYAVLLSLVSLTAFLFSTYLVNGSSYTRLGARCAVMAHATSCFLNMPMPMKRYGNIDERAEFPLLWVNGNATLNHGEVVGATASLSPTATPHGQYLGHPDKDIDKVKLKTDRLIDHILPHQPSLAHPRVM